MGKSTAGEILKEKGVEVIDTDQLARDAVQPGEPSVRFIRDVFGDDYFYPNGELDRRLLGNRVFSDPSARAQLEGILHPIIHQAWMEHIKSWRAMDVRIGAVIVPLLFEKGYETGFDDIVCVACSHQEQIRRLVKGRGWTAEEAQLRIAAQMPIDEKIRRSHLVIWTEGTLETHRAQWCQF